MDYTIIEVPDMNDSVSRVVLSGTAYLIRFTYNDSKDLVNVKFDRGDYVDQVTSENPNAYPTNGKHTDGYWYVKQ